MKSLVLLTVVLGVWVFPCRPQSAPEGQCTTPSAPQVKLQLKSHRNITGQWITQILRSGIVVLDHGTGFDAINAARGSWDVDVEQSISPCQGRETVHIVATLTAPPPIAGPDYELFPGVGYYKLHMSPLNWDQARKACISEGAHLVVINSEAESLVLQQIYSQYLQVKGAENQDYAYIGFHDRYTEGQYVTVLGTPLSSTGFTRWSGTGQPDNAGGGPGKPGEDCGTIHRNGGLNDITCHLKLAFFCEQELW
uniref:C-type lectin domain-containing protein n=1 Tax=Timema monikensis TaxID=170555 RepID=A0A7R9EHT4_9NEOP|nr:unnamed protein product [Timema monikensis]